MAENKDLLIELGTEELPPKALLRLSQAFTQGVCDGLQKAGVSYGEVKSFATPRRLAMIIANVPAAQPDREILRKGPAVQAAYDAAGNPTKAVIGFAKSCGVEVSELQTEATDKGDWLVFKAKEKGQAVSALLAGIVEQSLSKLPIPKRMRWGDRNAEFVRPVHWLVLMHGATVIDAEIMEVRSGNTTRGHRFHANDAIALKTSADYVLLLKQRGFVIADCAERKQLILNSVLSTAQQLGGTALINEELLDEVTALNEWPVPVAGEFDAAFLSVPAEALIKTMQDNQKYFPVLDARGALKNCFITISNIDSRAPQKVKAGNERVVRPRLADAKFFWEQDQKKPLEEFGRALEHVVFQAKLGSLGEKTRRVMVLCTHIAKRLGVNVALAERAALLSKCDLMTAMVGEFADLQGVMGKRYAEVAGEAPAVALALDEQYRPRGAGDDTASESIGQILAIADKLDTLVGIFAIGEKPTGEKDPYALRRCALGIVRTIIERQLDLDLHDLIALAVTQLQGRVDAAAVADDVFDYITERLRAYYADSGVTPDVFDAVHALKPARPLDFDKRIHAVTAFRHLEEAQSLAAANKRVGNILKKSADATQAKVQENLLQEVAEKELYANLCALHDKVDKLFNQGDYATALRELSVLRAPIDAFFDSVMVMVDDAALRQNRIALLSRMSALFMRAADLSRLQ